MPPSAERIPVQTVPTGKGAPPLPGSREVGRRRIFVQTDLGRVMGIEVDRGERVHSVKKKVQSLLNVATEQSALVYGDTVLKSDMSDLRNDTPLLLLLARGIHRSCSTPSLSPVSDTQPTDGNRQLVEIVGGGLLSSSGRYSRVNQMVKEISKAVERGVEPVPVGGGLGGAYYFRNRKGESIAILKPTDEEPFAPNNPKGFIGAALGQPGLKKGVRVGETGIREVAAYLLDHAHFANVPPTVLVKATHSIFHINYSNPAQRCWAKAAPVVKIASCQQFVHHDCDASDLGTSRFSVSAVHRIGILDIRILNTDRHAGNILVRKANTPTQYLLKDSTLELIPIDHGLCLPETLEDPYFEWLHWPQSSLPFSDEELDYICHLDIAKDVEMLRMELPMIREACLRVLILCTVFLKVAAASGLCLAEMGEMMSRDCGWKDKSELEMLCLLTKTELDEELEMGKVDVEEEEGDWCNSPSLKESISDVTQFEMDNEEVILSRSNNNSSNVGLTTVERELPFLSTPKALRNILTTLRELPSEEEEDSSFSNKFDTLSRESISSFAANNKHSEYGFGSVSAHPRRRRRKRVSAPEAEGGEGGGQSGRGSSSGGNNSIAFADMTEQEWNRFLQCFQEHLEEALRSRISKIRSGPRLRLGSSCQF